MKVKIRGLVFVGFAAAVFAQSAMADATTDAKTVTSKLYVDNKVEGVTETGSGANLTYGDTTITQNSPNDKAPSALNVYKFVTSEISGAAYQPKTAVGNGETSDTLKVGKGAGQWGNLEAVVDNTSGANPQSSTDYVTIREDNGVYKFNVPSAKIATYGATTTGANAHTNQITSGSDSLATAGAVHEYAETLTNKTTAASGGIAGDGTTGTSASDTSYPTNKAVYDFVTTQGGQFQPKVTTASATTMYVGKYVPDDPDTAGDQSQTTWDKLTTGTYVANTSTTAGTYTLDVPAAKITSATSDFAASGDTRAKLATAGTVYDFVSTNYQEKAATGGTTVQVGHDGGWTTLAGGDSYVNVAYNSASGHTQAEVTLTNIGTHGVAWTDGNSQSQPSDITNASTKIVTGQAVHEFVMAQLGNLPIPVPGADCADNTSSGSGGITSSNDKACALVLAYWSAADSPTGTAGVGLKWVPMAQTSGS